MEFLTFRNKFLFIILFIYFITSFVSATTVHSVSNCLPLCDENVTISCTNSSENACKEETTEHSDSGGIKVAKLDFKRVQTPYVICLWVLLGSLAKVAFHYSGKLSSMVPESCLLILLGLLIGGVLKGLGVAQQDVSFSSDTFFLFLLPPIILDAGYFMPTRAFYLNIGTILLYATVGTVFNTFTLGASLYAVRGIFDFELGLMESLLFGSFIAAVDPVAVLAVFEEVHVHEVLYILVFGESVLNDAASVVLYHTFEALLSSPINLEQVTLAIVSFLVVSIGGMVIGIAWGVATGFVTKFTEHVRVIEPIFVFIMAYIAYLTAEIFHFSGIMSILFCGMVMKPYVESNVSRKSHTTIKYFLKLLSTACETIIFMFLGVSLVVDNHWWDIKFVVLTIIFMLLYRVIGITILTGFANRCGRLNKINRVEQFIMSYGGLRGAVAFCLAVLIKVEHVKLKQLFVTTTVTVVLFTVFIQGTTIKPLVRLLNVKRSEKRETKMIEQLNDRMLDHLGAGMEEILGHRGHSFWREKLEYLNKRYFRHWLERNPDALLDEEIIQTHRKLAFKNALLLADNPSQFSSKYETNVDVDWGSNFLHGDIEGPPREDKWECVKRNPTYAFSLAVRQHSEQEEDHPTLDTGVFTGRPEAEPSKAFDHYNVTSLIPKSRKTSSLRKRPRSGSKYSLEALDEHDGVEEMTERYLKHKRNALAHMAPNSSSHHRRHSRKHKHKKRRNHHETGRSRKPNVETVPEVTEDEADASLRSLSSRQMSLDEEQGISFTSRTDRMPMKSHESFELNPFTDYYNEDDDVDDDEPINNARKDSGAMYLNSETDFNEPLLGGISPVGSPITDPQLSRDVSIDLSASLDNEIRMHAFAGQNEDYNA